MATQFGTVPSLATSSSSRAPLIELRGAILDIGILRDTLLPSFGLTSGLSLIAYGLARQSGRLDVKDLLWPSAQVLNAWYSAIGRRVIFGGVSLPKAVGALSRPEALLLGGVTLWGGRLFYRIFERSQRRGRDDERYTAIKKQDGFWNDALWKIFLPEALFQTVISLPFTAPFIHQGGVFTGYHPYMQSLAVAVWGTGFALEVLADYQLEKYKQSAAGVNGVNREGVWSIVRHPNYLGDMLIHLSFPLLLYSSDMLAPIELLAPIANYLFLRYVGGDRENENSQTARYAGQKKVAFEQYQHDETVDSFWPSVSQISNPWLWSSIGIGAALAVGEQVLQHLRFFM